MMTISQEMFSASNAITTEINQLKSLHTFQLILFSKSFIYVSLDSFDELK